MLSVEIFFKIFTKKPLFLEKYLTIRLFCPYNLDMHNLFSSVVHLVDDISDETSVLNSHLLNSGDVNYHDHSFYEITYVLDGNLPHYVNEQKMDLTAGDVVFLRPKDRHVYVRDNNCTAYHRDIIFRSKFFESVLNFLHPELLSDYHKNILPYKVNLPTETIDKFEKLINEYYSISTENLKARIIFAKTILIELLYFYNLPNLKLSNDHPLLVNQIIQRLNKRNNLKRGIQWIFNNFNYSKSHICNTFKKHMHVSLTEYINNQRLNYAASLLKFTNNSLFDISQECGFSSLSYFNKLFKSKYTCTPAKFRKGNTKE